MISAREGSTLKILPVNCERKFFFLIRLDSNSGHVHDFNLIYHEVSAGQAEVDKNWATRKTGI